MSNVRDFGAIGDGHHKDTQAIQRALDAGGLVYFPPGVYLTGTLFLRSHGGIVLAAGALVLGSPDPEDYNSPYFCPQNSVCKPEKAYGGHLIVGLEVQDVSIRGQGVVDGNRKAFFDPAKCSRDQFQGWRPSQMIFFCESRDIVLEDVSLQNSPYWACFLFGCENSRVEGLKIHNPKGAWNGDGLDIDCCRQVCVSNCVIHTSDDSLAVRASGANRLQHTLLICENVVVSNCVLTSGQAGIRVGVGSGIIRHCLFNNLTIEAGFGICVLSTYLAEEFPAGQAGVEIEDLLFSNCSIRAAVPFDLTSNWIRKPLKTSLKTISQITFRGIHAWGFRSSLIMGNEDSNVSEVCFSDVVLTISGGSEFHSDGQWHFEGSEIYRHPYGLIVRNVKSFRLQNFRLRWHGASDQWMHALYAANVHDIYQDSGCSLDAPPQGQSCHRSSTCITE